MNGKKQLPKPVKPTDTVTTLGIKVYTEQCPLGFEKVLRAVISLPSNSYDCYAIVHNKEGKPHLHIAIRLKHGSSKVSTLLRKLGIKFRKEDLSIMSNRGLETLGSFRGYLRYLTHTDSNSLANPKKKKYELKDFYTNMDTAIFNSLLGRTPITKKLTRREQFEHACREAKDAGYNLWKFDKWLNTKEYEFLSYSKKDRKTIEDFFNKGQAERIKDGLPQIVICIYQPKSSKIKVQQIEDIVKASLSDLHISEKDKSDGDSLLNNIGCYNLKSFEPFINYSINNGECIRPEVEAQFKKEGYYELNGYHGGLTYKINILDDPNWDDYFKKKEKLTFYYCHIDEENQMLICEKPDKSGSNSMQLDRKKLYTDFRDAFNYHFQVYISDKIESSNPSEEEIDYSDL